MTLDEAIEHAEEVANSNCCSECSKEHKQLVEWLKELKQYRLIGSINEILNVYDKYVI